MSDDKKPGFDAGTGGMTRRPKATFGDVMKGTAPGARDEKPRRKDERRPAGAGKGRTATGKEAPIFDAPAPLLAAPAAPEPEETESFADLFAAAEKSKPATEALKPGAKVSGEIFMIGKATAFVSLGAKGEGMIDLAELIDDDGNATVKVGDRLEAFVVRTGAEGILLSKGLARHGASAGMLEDARASGLPIEGRVTGVNPGGLEVELGAGVRAFCPVSQIALGFVEDPAKFIGQKLAFRVTELRGKDIVVSRKALLAAEQAERAAETKKKLDIGVVMKGTVTSVRDFGAFVDVGGIEGMIPRSELGHARGLIAADVLQVGSEIEAEVIRIEAGDPGSPDRSRRKDRITLSLRALEADPWDVAMTTLTDGARVKGTVARVAAFGVFVTVAPGVDGLLHSSQLGSMRPKVGEAVDVKLENIDQEQRRISLALDREEGPAPANARPTANATPTATANSTATASVRPPAPRPGMIVDAAVERIEPYGVFVAFPGGKGLVPAAETGTPQGADLKRALPLGTKVRAAILDIDERGRLRLSISEVARIEERAEAEEYQANQRTTQKGRHGFGTFADLLKKQ